MLGKETPYTKVVEQTETNRVVVYYTSFYRDIIQGVAIETKHGVSGGWW